MPARVLVVEDHSETAEVLSRLLATQGCAVHTVTESRKALEVAKDFKPHIIFLDTAMPQQDGYATARQIRSDADLNDSVVVALSGYCRESDRQEAFAAGADHFLAKPASMEQILALVVQAGDRTI